MINTAFLSELKRFYIVVNKRVTSSFSGTRRSTSFGRGSVTNDFRPYVIGDDYRRIDWKIYARTDDFFVKNYEEERDLTVRCLIDVSKSMDFTTTEYTKFEYASMLAIGFAYISGRNNEKFHLSLVSEETESFRAKRTSNEVLTFLNYLNNVSCKGVIKFSRELKKYRTTIDSRSLVIIISDFLFDIEEVKKTLHMFKNHELIVIQILDKYETSFEVYGSLLIQDSETKRKKEIFVSEERRQEYKKRLYDHIVDLERETLSSGGKFFLFSNENNLFEAFYKILNS